MSEAINLLRLTKMIAPARNRQKVEDQVGAPIDQPPQRGRKRSVQAQFWLL